MNGPGDIPLTLSTTPDTRPCGLISIIPTIGMSSCRGRAEAFARRLSSKLRTLGSQTDDGPMSQEDEPIINGTATNTWMTPHESDQTVTALQPLRHEADSFFDFDCELESPGSPVDECEYLRLIETASNTPHNSAAESGYVCASAASSQNSSDGPFFDVENSDCASAAHESPSTTIPAAEYVSTLILNCNGSPMDRLTNGHNHHTAEDSESIEGIQDKQTHGHSKQTVWEALPLNGEDIATVKMQTESAEDPQLTAQKMAKVQDEIIMELQKQSEKFNGSDAAVTTSQIENDYSGNFEKSSDWNVAYTISRTEDDHCNQTEMNSTAPAKPSNSSEFDNTESIPAVIHNITNDHTEDGEAVLKVEITEQESKTKHQDMQPHAECSVSQPENTEEKEEPQVNEFHHTNSDCEKPPKPEEPKRSLISVLDTTDDEEDCRPQRVRRCSSLKTGKTPPGTPGRKKIVRFADVLGLDLADIKTFLDEVPTIPKSAFEDLEIMESEPPMQMGPRSDKLLMPLFQQPGGLPTFLDLVREKQVSLENAAITDPINQTITGSVRVRNLDFNKSVHIRYTLDGWRSFADLQANYAQNSCDGFSDKFTFVIFGNSLRIGQRLELAVRFQCRGQQFWDNNFGTNYCFQCLPTRSAATNPIPAIVPSHHTSNIVELLSPTAGDAWCSSFY